MTDDSLAALEQQWRQQATVRIGDLSSLTSSDISTYGHARYGQALQQCADDLAAWRAQHSWQRIARAPKNGWLLLWGPHFANPVIGRWSVCLNCWMDYEAGIYEPTHWMPLLAPPEEQS